MVDLACYSNVHMILASLSAGVRRVSEGQAIKANVADCLREDVDLVLDGVGEELVQFRLDALEKLFCF